MNAMIEIECEGRQFCRDTVAFIVIGTGVLRRGAETRSARSEKLRAHDGLYRWNAKV